MGVGFDVVDRVALVARLPGLTRVAQLGDVAFVVFSGVGYGSVRHDSPLKRDEGL